MKAFFLYTELADYTMLCFKKHLEMHPEDEIHVVHFPVNSEAPFVFETAARLHLYNKQGLEVADLWDIFNRVEPSVVLCSGWSDGMYNKFVKTAGKMVPVILCFDNFFRYTMKQFVGVPVARALFKGVFSGVWVPGVKQKAYARILGFEEDRIFTCFYSTDATKYDAMYHKYLPEKSSHFPKRFLCVARYIPQKGLPALWQAFAELSAEENHGWELWCVGSGEGFEDRMLHPKIRHLGFVQPEGFDELVRQCGVFVLPSLFEPWGVVVNEFAAAGFPLALSQKVGSGVTLLEEGVNGHSFAPGKIRSIKATLKKFIDMPQDELLTMAAASVVKGKLCNAEKWSATLTRLSGLARR